MKNNYTVAIWILLLVVFTPVVVLGIIFSLNMMGLEVDYTWKSFLGCYLLMFFMRISSTPLK